MNIPTLRQAMQHELNLRPRTKRRANHRWFYLLAIPLGLLFYALLVIRFDP
jgi:hypothetical protein